MTSRLTTIYINNEIIPNKNIYRALFPIYMPISEIEKFILSL